ncbi:MAG: PD-(D/E)XK nuclease family protein, partial [Pseudomonadota bacterium]|nr:PD-(D/E)XK nuclease family protein [Pseudomonadota bacterium]
APGRPPAASGADGEAVRLGQAVHRVLEWATTCAPDEWPQLAEAAAAEFGASATGVAQRAEAILRSRACERFFRGPALRWAGNEVPIGDASDVLRIDRLVKLQAEGSPAEWWVLDYKLHHAPQELAAYRDQLRRYRDAVARAQSGERVRAAFITGTGAVVEIDAPLDPAERQLPLFGG